MKTKTENSDNSPWCIYKGKKSKDVLFVNESFFRFRL